MALWLSRKRVFILRNFQFTRRYINNFVSTDSLSSHGINIMLTSDPMKKVELTQKAVNIWKSNDSFPIGHEQPPDYPARPENPKLVPPKEMPTLKKSKVGLPIYLLHSLAHIELNAIDLTWDMLIRFTNLNLPHKFYSDWVSVVDDESKHFLLLANRLKSIGSYYGVMPAHKSLWDDVVETKHDLKARLALLHIFDEGKALDAWPRLCTKLISVNDKESSQLVDKICSEEIAHVKYGIYWFKYLCDRENNSDCVSLFHSLMRNYLTVPLNPPFNTQARQEAGLDESWYVPLSNIERAQK